jgi:hypothetical protein
VSANPPSIAAIDFERGLDAVRSKAAGPGEGVFGPGSTIWQVDREALVFLGAERRSALRALRLIRRMYPVLPTRLRYVAPYHEALGRRCGRSRPDLMTRALNYLWIGRECMAD